jgi:hypothetical protein
MVHVNISATHNEKSLNLKSTNATRNYSQVMDDALSWNLFIGDIILGRIIRKYSAESQAVIRQTQTYIPKHPQTRAVLQNSYKCAMELLLNSQGATGDIGGVPCAHHRIIRCVGNGLVCWLVIRGGGVENRTTPVVDESHHILNRAADVLCVCVRV